MKLFFDNYRPISILPSISKVFERILFNQIHTYFHVNNLYFCSQYGFRKEHSTELAVLELIDRITQHLEKGTIPINVYLDLSKAFDTLDHNILILNRISDNLVTNPNQFGFKPKHNTEM